MDGEDLILFSWEQKYYSFIYFIPILLIFTNFALVN